MIYEKSLDYKKETKTESSGFVLETKIERFSILF